MKYPYLNQGMFPQLPVKEHVYQPTEADEALTAQMRDVAERIKKQLEGKWTPAIGDTVLYIDESTTPLNLAEGEQGVVTYLGYGWFQVTWDNIGMRSYGMNCIVSGWIVKAP